MGICACGATLASLMSAPPAALAGWGRRRCRAGGCRRDAWQCAASARGQGPGWKLRFQATDLDLSVPCKALGRGRIGSPARLSFSTIYKMVPLPRLQKLLVAPSTAERLKDTMLIQASGSRGHESRLSWVFAHLQVWTAPS